jgi:hypothetical protein
MIAFGHLVSTRPKAVAEASATKKKTAGCSSLRPSS